MPTRKQIEALPEVIALRQAQAILRRLDALVIEPFFGETRAALNQDLASYILCHAAGHLEERVHEAHEQQLRKGTSK